MPRKNRIKSPLGIYHVMLRGINKQNIFFCEEDFVRMMTILQEVPFQKDPLTGKVITDNLCTIYAYCILDNHLHLLIREGKQSISEVMKRIEDRYALYYNKRYERIGHLFQARFPSEPVNDSGYFYTLLRYIHRNPVKAMEAKTPEEYPYSSWNEYVMYTTTSVLSNQNVGNNPTPPSSNILRVLKPSAIQAVIRKYPLDDLIPWVSFKDPSLPDDGTPTLYTREDVERANQCLDMDSFTNVITDQNAMEILLDLSGLTNPEDFRLLDAPTQIYHLLQAIDHGVNIRQASRLGTITEYQLRKAHAQKVGDTSHSGSVPEYEKKLEILSPAALALSKAIEKVTQSDEELLLQRHHQRVRTIEGLGKKTYHKLHQIVDYLSVHPESKCQDLADALQVTSERARQYLIRLSNVNVVTFQGNARSRTYTLASR